MSKLKVVVVKDDVKPVLAFLARSGQVQVIDVKEEQGPAASPMFLSSSTYLEKLDNVTNLLEQVDVIISKLSLTCKGSCEPSLEDADTLDEKVKPLLSEAGENLASMSAVSDELERLAVERKALEAVIEFGVSSHWLSGAKRVFAVAGVIDDSDIPELNELLTEKTGDAFALMSGSGADASGSPVIIITTEEYKKDVERLLENAKFNRSYVSDPKIPPEKELARINEESKRMSEEEKRIQEKIALFVNEKGHLLVSARDFLEYEKKIVEAALLLGKTKTASILSCWAPSKKVASLVKALEDITSGAVHVNEEKPSPKESVPVMLDNPSLIKPFETITRSYGLPGYYEIDPTIFLAVSFPLIFGMMFGDVGHGLIIAASGFILARVKKDDATLRDFARIFAYCGLTSTFFGFLYGSVFGLETVFAPIWFSPIHHLKQGLVKELIGLALFVGFIQMMLGIVIDSVNKFYSHGLSNTVLGSVARIMLFFGVAVLIMKLFGFPVPLISSLAGTSAKTLALAGFLAPVLLILAEEVSHSLRAPMSINTLSGAIGTGLLESFETTSMFLSNMISYSRIIILALIHAMLSEVVYVIGHLAQRIPFIGFLAYYAVLLVGSAALILGLEGLVVYVHTIRLHFYEWFTKFYGGAGLAYKPFKAVPR
ncbi:MAG: V-type ATPase 116kDa subunit family protein [Candidatus Altiarchaeota archaeon]